jgi:uncharacterized damage-inducible protein DinB
MIDDLKILFQRDLGRLHQEISLYRNEMTLWHIEKEISNSGGNLCLHLIGNLNTYVGAQFGGSGYIRERALEFSQKNIPRETLLQNIEKTTRMVQNALDSLTDQDMHLEYPLLVFEKRTSTGYFLLHLSGHLTYHLGQINYHRRLLD